MARVIPFYIPAKFKPGRPRLTGLAKVIDFGNKNSKTITNGRFWVALEKMLPDLRPQTHQ